MNNISLLPLTSEDDQRTVEFCREIYAEMGWTEETLGESILTSFNQDGDIFLVAKQGEAVVGTGGIQKLSPDDALMKKFYLAKKVRGTGLSKKLFEELVKRARSLNYKTLVLDVSSNNPAVHFYEKQEMQEFQPESHPRWEESSPEGQKTHRYFRLKL